MQRIFVSNTILNLTKDICTYPGDNCIFNFDTGRLTIYRAGDLLASTEEVSSAALRSMTLQGWLTPVVQSPAPVIAITPNPVLDTQEPLPLVIAEPLVEPNEVLGQEDRKPRKSRKTKPDDPEEGLEA